MNSRDVVVILEQCRQAAVARPKESTEEDLKESQRCKATLSTEVRSLLHEAMSMSWPFVPEKWQYKQSLTSEDKANLKELISQNLPQLLALLKASILVEDPQTAISVVFLVDRFLYWADASNRLLQIGKALHNRYPATPIAPQVVIRQARVSVSSGKLQKAEYILSDLINNSGTTGCWMYQADSDRTLVQSVSVQVRGQVLQKLGLWLEAAELIWASLVGFFALPQPDKKGIGTSLGILANILINMNDKDFLAMTTSPYIDLSFLKERNHRLLSAAEAAKMAVVYSQYASLYVLTNVVTQGTCFLAHSFSADCPETERRAFLTKAKEAFEIGLLTKNEDEMVTSKQELHTFVKAANSLTVSHRWLGSSLEVVDQAEQACRKAMEKLYHYIISDGPERDRLEREIMHLVGQVKVLLQVRPFLNSDECSFIPDSYKTLEEAPIRFSLESFSKVMERFQQYHTSVCQAFETSCQQSANGRGGVCLTALRTATETLDTLEYNQSNKRPRGTPGNGQKGSVGRHQPLSRKASSGDNIAIVSIGTNRVTVASEYRERVRTSSSSLNDSMGSHSSWQKISYPDPGSSLSTRTSREKQTGSEESDDGWVDMLCPTEVSEEDGLNSLTENARLQSLAVAKEISGENDGKKRISPSNSSHTSWQTSCIPEDQCMQCHTDAGSPSEEGKGQTVDMQCPTEDWEREEPNCCGNDSAYQNSETSSSSLGGSLGSHCSWQMIYPETGSSLQSEASSDKQISAVAVERVEGWVDMHCPTEVSEEGWNSVNPVPTGQKSLPNHLGMLGFDSYQLCEVDSNTKVEQGVPDKSAKHAHSADVLGPPAVCPETCLSTETRSPFELIEDEDMIFRKTRSQEKLHVPNNSLSRKKCFQQCMMGNQFLEYPCSLSVLDYKALLSGVCHKCLIKRLSNTGIFKLGKHRSSYSALLLKYSKEADLWTSCETMVYVGDSIGKQGKQRTAFWVQFLHQEEILGSYVGKEYLFAKELHYHLDDVERQMTAQYYVTEFNKKLYEERMTMQIFFIPSDVLLILEDHTIVGCMTVEPYMLGDFVKLTNNTTEVARDYKATDYGIAFGHFTFEFSGGTEIVVDLQGWVTANGKGLTYLTDPQIHSLKTSSTRTNFSERGIRNFLEVQHGPQCNKICQRLSLGKLL